jgi:hypothetical protein
MKFLLKLLLMVTIGFLFTITVVEGASPGDTYELMAAVQDNGPAVITGGEELLEKAQSGIWRVLEILILILSFWGGSKFEAYRNKGAMTTVKAQIIATALQSIIDTYELFRVSIKDGINQQEREDLEASFKKVLSDIKRILGKDVEQLE